MEWRTKRMGRLYCCENSIGFIKGGGLGRIDFISSNDLSVGAQFDGLIEGIRRI
jgi:hypothetical protein